MIGQRLSHYRIEGLLGAGGMGEVYLAEDLAMGRRAAIKLLPSRFTAAQRARLLVEAGASSRLQHPGIATFYESGQDDGVTYIAMEYVEGLTLRQCLREGPLPETRALALASALLEGLAHAHAAGIVHRDIKPENIMVTGERTAKLLDFGLARELSDAAHADVTMATALTAVDAVVGTPGYMAPEQLTGGTVDARTDLFALGAVLAEMLSGTPVHGGDTPMQRMAATLAAPRIPDCAPALREILERTLARNAETRPAGAADLLRRLRRLGEGLAVASFPDTVAVMDFENRSGDPADAWIGGGIAESLGADLGRLDGVRVVPRPRVGAVAAAAGPGAAATDVGARLGCRWIVSGGYQRSGAALRVVAEFADVATGEVLARDKVDGTCAGLFDVQDRIAQRAAAVLARDRGGGLPARPTESIQAYECLARGREQFIRMTKGAFMEAQDWFEEAIRQDAHYADALASLAGLHDMRFTFTTDPGELERAVGYARRAIASDPRHGLAYVWLAYGLWRRGEREAALEAARKAEACDPSGMYPPYFAACILLDLGRPAEALPLYQRSVERAPAYGFGWVGLGNAHMELAQFDEALWSLEQGAELETRGFHATAGSLGYVGECLRRMGRAREGREKSAMGLEAVERTDHMYRDTFRAVCFNALGRSALDDGDTVAASAAFTQCLMHLDGRGHTLGGGPLRTQALAGRAAAERDPALFERALASLTGSREGNASWIWLGTDAMAARDLVHAARVLGREDAAAPWSATVPAHWR